MIISVSLAGSMLVSLMVGDKGRFKRLQRISLRWLQTDDHSLALGQDPPMITQARMHFISHRSIAAILDE